MEPLRPFQKRFLRRALAPGIDIAALSIPRGNGKSWLAAHILSRGMIPGDSLHYPGTEYLLCAASIEQARLCFRFVVQALGGVDNPEYRFNDSATRLAILHKASSTKLRVISSNGKSAMGIVNSRILVADEPGSWEVNGGQLMADAIETAMGKPGSPLKAIFIGTLAPATSGWWHQKIEDGSHGSTYVQALKGDPEKWDNLREVKRCNPLTAISPEFLAKLKEEREAAWRDTRLKARFLSYRLNLPTQDSSTTLLTVDDWLQVEGREVPEPEGKAIVAVDLGANRSWSAAVAMWRNGRVDAIAVAPGIPDIAAQEKRDRVPGGTYQRLVDAGLLRIADGLRVVKPDQLWGAIREEWGKPDFIVVDRFRLDELKDAVGTGARIEDRVTRWSDASYDIRATRKAARDGPMACVPEARALIKASLSVAMVKNDDQGSVRMVKRGTNNEARDDVAAALCLVAGANARKPVKTGVRSLGLAG